MKCVCMGCTEATGRSWDCHTRCDGYKEFQAKNEKEKNVIKMKKPYYKSLSKEKFMKRNALNRNRRGRKIHIILLMYKKISANDQNFSGP